MVEKTNKKPIEDVLAGLTKTEVCGSINYNDRTHIGFIIQAARQAAADNRYEEFHDLFGEALEEIYNIFVEQQQEE
jgi:hypothetical protein